MEALFMNLPSPIDIILNPVSLIVIGLYGLLIVWEALFPARPLPYIKYWKTKGIIAFFIYFFLSTYFPILWDTYLIQFQVFDLTVLGTYWGALIAFVIYQLGLYTWHRAMHKSDFLWRIFHQMHHSAERIDSYGAFYFSFMDMIGFTFLSSLCLVVVAGFTAEATTIFILVTTFFAIFQHTNIKTPQWLGYIVQRPEGHAYHHGRGIHANNYCDLSVIDMLFGTFTNPKEFVEATGFYDGASGKISEMLLFKDISTKQDEKQYSKESTYVEINN